MVAKLAEDPRSVRRRRNAKQPPLDADKEHIVKAQIRAVDDREQLGIFSTGALILNKQVGTGIFVAPPVVLAITGSKGISLILWFVGGLVTWAGLVVYLEYGLKFPLTGGELHYIDRVWNRRPKKSQSDSQQLSRTHSPADQPAATGDSNSQGTRPENESDANLEQEQEQEQFPGPSLMTYLYSIQFVLLSGSHANALVFGKAVLTASTPAGTRIDFRLQKFFAVLIVAVVCCFQAFSRLNYVRFSNIFAIYKLTLLTIITILGLYALAKGRKPASVQGAGPYGLSNLEKSFRGTTNSPYAISIALLNIFRVYSGYENANFVLEEVKRGPPKDRHRVYRKAAKGTVLIVTFFYLMVNLAMFAACSKEELLAAPDTLSLFFSKVFRYSPRTRAASGILLSMSSAGNIMSITFASSRVKQEIARLGVLPLPEFWAPSTRYGTPGPALLQHWIFSTILIIVCPLESPNGYLVISTLFNYNRTLVSVVLGVALLYARRLKSFMLMNEDGQLVGWSPQGSARRTDKKGFSLYAILIYPLTIIYVLANLGVFVLCWFPARLQDAFPTAPKVVPSYAGPIAGLSCFAAGGLCWLWDRQILRRTMYKFIKGREEMNGLIVDVLFQRKPTTRFGEWLVSTMEHLGRKLKQIWAEGSSRNKSIIASREQV